MQIGIDTYVCWCSIFTILHSVQISENRVPSVELCTAAGAITFLPHVLALHILYGNFTDISAVSVNILKTVNLFK